MLPPRRRAYLEFFPGEDDTSLNIVFLVQNTLEVFVLDRTPVKHTCIPWTARKCTTYFGGDTIGTGVSLQRSL